MRETVVIKGNKSGMTVILDDQVPFDELLLHVAKKFRESARFWGSVQMTLSLEGRPLSAREELMIVDQISENSGIEILCLLDRDLSRIERCEKALNERLMELSSRTGQFYKGNLKRGETLESEASIVIIGDVGHGAKVMARGNIIVLGFLLRHHGAGDGSHAAPDRRLRVRAQGKREASGTRSHDRLRGTGESECKDVKKEFIFGILVKKLEKIQIVR